MTERQRHPSTSLSKEELREFFINHLNRIFCAKSQLTEHLPQLADNSHFRDLQQAICDTIDVVRLQLDRMRTVYIALDDFYHPESCVGLVGILDEAFQSIGTAGQSPAMRDLSILFYMNTIESIEMASFLIMLRVADRLDRPEIAQSIRECYDEAREDKLLFKQITDTYI